MTGESPSPPSHRALAAILADAVQGAPSDNHVAGDDLLSLALRHRVLPLFANAAQLDLSVPGRQRMHMALLRCKAQFTAAQLRRAEIATALAATDIPALGFKGYGLAVALYPHPILRDTGDIDVLILPQQLSAAGAALEKAGFQRRDPLRHLPGMLARLGERRSKDITLASAGTTVELHGRALFSPRLNRLLMALGPDFQLQSCAGGLAGPPVGPQLTLYLILHGASSMWICMKWLVDVAFVLMRLSEPERMTVADFAERTHSASAVRASLLLLDEVFPAASLGGLRAWCQRGRDPGVAAKLARYRSMFLAKEPRHSPTNNRRLALHSELMLHDHLAGRVSTVPIVVQSSGYRALGRLAAKFPS